MNVNWLEWAKVTFDLIKGVAWPFALLLITWIFRKELRDRIKDIVSLGPGGAVLQAPSQSSQAKPPTGLTTAAHPLATVQALIAKIDGQLADIPEDERISKLVAALAEAQIERDFENVFGLIFGSQITALRRLKEAGSVSLEEAKNFYESEIRPQFQEAFSQLSYEQWSEFLFNYQLIFSVESNRLTLTDRGRDFLAFVDLRKQGVSKGL
ncbi:hypothetical protein A6U87_02140 [Rhizobium sp. AC44/96]|nr:hypothetical protein A6U87_02140 [Rhizobium sp. AC44/96]